MASFKSLDSTKEDLAQVSHKPQFLPQGCQVTSATLKHLMAPGREEGKDVGWRQEQRTVEGVGWRSTGQLAQKGVCAKEETFSVPFCICMTQTNSASVLNSIGIL